MTDRPADPTTIHGLMESEHQWVDARFTRFLGLLDSGVLDGSPFFEASGVLHRHIYLEEEILFPELERHGLSGPVAVMALEHGEIWRNLADVAGLIRADADVERVRASLKALEELLDAHNFKEEQILYPAADEVVSPEQLPQMLDALRESQAPPGWVCRAHQPG